MKTALRILALSLSLAAIETHAQSVILGNYQATGGAENGSISGASNLGASVSYDATAVTRNDYGIFSFTDGSSGGVTFANVGDSVVDNPDDSFWDAGSTILCGPGSELPLQEQ